MHPGADVRSEVLLSNLRGMLSKDELVEYANVYELREDGPASNVRGRTREVVYKTNMRPLETSLIEKGLLSRRKGYAEYMLARIGALRAMGVTAVFDRERADFSALCNAECEMPLWVSGVRQQARISVNEDGIEAAGYTRIDYVGAPMPTGRADMILDRPFLYYISAEGGMLFAGIVNRM